MAAATSDPGWLEWITAISTLAAVVIALLLGLGAVEWWRRPRLRLEIADDPFDRVTTMTVGAQPAAYLRARVVNEGRSVARHVTVAVLEVAEWTETPGQWTRKKPELDGRALAWSNADPDATIDIPSGVERPIDVISIVRNWGQGQQGQMPIRVEIRGPVPANAAHLLAQGAWRLRVEVSAENVVARDYEIVVNFRGFWPADPPERIWEVIGVQGPGKPGSIARPSEPQTPLAQLVQTAANQDVTHDES